MLINISTVSAAGMVELSLLLSPIIDLLHLSASFVSQQAYMSCIHVGTGGVVPCLVCRACSPTRGYIVLKDIHRTNAGN